MRQTPVKQTSNTNRHVYIIFHSRTNYMDRAAIHISIVYQLRLTKYLL